MLNKCQYCTLSIILYSLIKHLSSYDYLHIIFTLFLNVFLFLFVVSNLFFSLFILIVYIVSIIIYILYILLYYCIDLYFIIIHMSLCLYLFL